MTPPTPFAATDQTSASSNRLILMVFTAAIFTSALLLFSVQPLFTKMVLPRLGGSPAVWSVAMVFFQSLLLGGYAYAHLLMRIKNRLLIVGVHCALLVIALLTLPVAVAGNFARTLWQMMLLATVLCVVFATAGLAMCVAWNTPAGATIVMLAGVTYIAVAGFKVLRAGGRHG